MIESRPIGPILDELGITIAVDDTDRLTEVLILAKTMNLDTGRVGLIVASNDLDWIAVAGLHAAANQVLMGDPPVSAGDDE